MPPVLSRSVVSDTVKRYGLEPTRLFCQWNSPGKNVGMGCHALLQGIFLTQGSNPYLFCLLHWQACSLPPAHLEGPANALGECPFVVGKRIKANLPVLKLCFPTSLPHAWGLRRTVQDALPESESFKSAQEIMVFDFHQWSIFLK